MSYLRHFLPRLPRLPRLAVLALAQACTPSTSPPDHLLADAGPGARRVAVINSDRKSVSVSLFDAASGKLLRDDCVNSGTAQPAPALSLSGDVVLPTAPQAGHELVLID